MECNTWKHQRSSSQGMTSIKLSLSTIFWLTSQFNLFAIRTVALQQNWNQQKFHFQEQSSFDISHRIYLTSHQRSSQVNSLGITPTKSNATAPSLTTNCRRFLDLSLVAGITSTFMIWTEPGRALWRAPMSRSVTTPMHYARSTYAQLHISHY